MHTSTAQVYQLTAALQPLLHTLTNDPSLSFPCLHTYDHRRHHQEDSKVVVVVVRKDHEAKQEKYNS